MNKFTVTVRLTVSFFNFSHANSLKDNLKQLNML